MLVVLLLLFVLLLLYTHVYSTISQSTTSTLKTCSQAHRKDVQIARECDPVSTGRYSGKEGEFVDPLPRRYDTLARGPGGCLQL